MTWIVIPTYLRERGDLEFVRDAIDSIYHTCRNEDVSIALVDACSPNRELVKQLPDLLWDKSVPGYVNEHHNSAFSEAVNVGLQSARQAETDAVLMNADVKLTQPGWLRHWHGGSEHSSVGIQGAKLLFGNGLIQHAGIYFSVLTRDFDHIYRYAPGDLHESMIPRECPVTAALMHISADCLQEVGLFDEGFQLGWEDVDYCLRAINAGYISLYNPLVTAIHYESVFRRKSTPQIAKRTQESWEYLWQKIQHMPLEGKVPIMLSEGEGWYDRTPMRDPETGIACVD